MSLSIGERLKSARNTRGTTLEEACKATKVQRKILEALEQDRVDEVLDSTYAKIFMKKYASFLGLDGSALVDEYLALSGPAPERPIGLETEATRRQTVSYRQVFVPAMLGLVALIGLCFIGYLASDLYGTLMKDRKPVPARTAAVKNSSRGPVVERVPEAPRLIIPRSQPLKLTIRTKADVWMQIKSDGAGIFQNVLPKGAQESWIAKEELELWTGNAGAMELVLNGRSLGNPGTGVKKGIRVTREGLKQAE